MMSAEEKSDYTELEKNALRKILRLEKVSLPLTIIFKDKRYVLMMTKNDKLILQKAVN